MSLTKLIADSGSTKAEWCVINGNKKKIFVTQGMSPYFISSEQMQDILVKELLPHVKRINLDDIFYYGTGCINPQNVKMVKKVIKNVFPNAKIEVDHDLSAAAKALCGKEKGIAKCRDQLPPDGRGIEHGQAEIALHSAQQPQQVLHIQGFVEAECRLHLGEDLG